MTEFSSRVTALSFTVIFPVASKVVDLSSSEAIVVAPVPLPTEILPPFRSAPCTSVLVDPAILTAPSPLTTPPFTATVAPSILTSFVASIAESVTVVAPSPGLPIKTDTSSSVPSDAPRVTPETLVSAAPLMATVPLPVVTLPPVTESELSLPVAAISTFPSSDVTTRP